MSSQNFKIDFLNDLKNDVSKFVHNFSSILAHRISEEMVEEYKYIIDRFYREYDPKFYKRHSERGMQPGLEKTFKKYYKNSHGSIYYGGIEITSENMYSDYQESKDKVLDSFLNGYHGRPNSGVWSSLLPYKHMIKFRNQMISALKNMDDKGMLSNPIISESRAKAVSLGYKLIKFM